MIQSEVSRGSEGSVAAWGLVSGFWTFIAVLPEVLASIRSASVSESFSSVFVFHVRAFFNHRRYLYF